MDKQKRDIGGGSANVNNFNFYFHKIIIKFQHIDMGRRGPGEEVGGKKKWIFFYFFYLV